MTDKKDKVNFKIRDVTNYGKNYNTHFTQYTKK